MQRVTLSRGREKLLGRLRHRKTRRHEDLFLAEGPRVAQEALAAGADIAFALCSPRLLRVSRGRGLEAALREAGVEVCGVSDRKLASLADTASPQGVLLVCHEPVRALVDGAFDAPEVGVERSSAPERFLVLEGLQDPGNVGTLVRAAAAFALNAVLALEGTVDPFGPKAVRAAAGSTFKIPVVRANWAEVEPWLERRGVPILVADAGGVDVEALDPGPGWALVVGGEGAGVRGQIRRSAARLTGLLMPGGTESLNAAVAGAILLYALTNDSRRGA